MRQIKTILTILLLITTIASCTLTSALWEKKSYDETITQFFVSADGRYIVLIGAGYHYVLTDNSNVLRTVLSLKNNDALEINPEETYLEIDDNNISGELVLEGSFNVLSSEDMIALRKVGIKPDSYDGVAVTVKISGRRYLPRYLGNAASSLKFPYSLKIRYGNSSVAKNVGKAAITPVTVSLDAVLMIGKIIIFPLKSD